MDFPALPERLREIRERVLFHQGRGGFSHPVRIVAVTKSHGPDAVRAAVAAGLADIGENRVQEALAKQEELAALPARWHLICRLQRNKAKHAAGRFALIHSVDRPELALELARRVAPESRQAVLVEVNCSGEPQKGGVEPEGLEALLATVAGLPQLELQGLMTLAELSEDERVQRAAFGKLRMLRERMSAAGFPLPVLSMGMSADYGIAVEEGATLVRLGTLLFGERPR
jgi:pyridoxal phosphate enzyme (YggS family)